MNPTQSERPIVLVCGSRDWPAPWFVTQKMLDLIPSNATVLAGGAPGVDQHAAREAMRLGWPVLEIKADWEAHGKRAGFIRNLVMLDCNPAKVLAFHAHGSKGTAHTIREAYKRGIELHVFTEADLRPDIAALDMGDVE